MKNITNVFKYDSNCTTCGLTKELNALYIANYFDNHDENVIVLASTFL